MYFLDNSAHIFSLPDYNKNPIGYEYDEQDYIFWFEDQNDNTKLSINNYYGKIINVLFEVSNINDLDNTSISSIYNIDITCDSENFKLIKAKDFQNALYKQQSILDYINIKTQSKKLTSDNNDDILVLKVKQDNKNYIILPLYIIGTSKYSGTWLTNILIHISNKFTNEHTWCPITIGGIFDEEYESLVIHGRNMGIDLPKDIIKAINGTSFFNDQFDEELYNKKIKEYLLNYLNIKGECGNYESAINSLKWFGYNDSIELYKLLETDNQFKNQYVRDYFDIQLDIIEAYNNFLNSQFVGLKYKLNEETGENEIQNLNNQFWGEGLPILSDNTNKTTYVHTNEYLGEEYGDDNQQFKYQSTYLNYTINELMFKLSCVQYYYQTYFLPIFIILKNLHIEYKVYSTPVKYFTYAYDHVYEDIINTQNQYDDIEFNDEHELYFTHQIHYVDKYFNEFGEKGQDEKYNVKENSYEINDTCLYIPIKFLDNKYYNCILLLKDIDNDQIVYKSNFSFINNENNKYFGFVFYPKMIEELQNIKLYTYVNKNYILYLNVNNKWYEYNFISRIQELDVHIGTLEYKYWINDINYFNDIYHQYDYENEDKQTINDTQIIFTFHNENSEDINLDITNYISKYDFFDYPTKYFSNFTQIDDIIDDEENSKVVFNAYMNDQNFVQLDDSHFGLYQKYNDLTKTRINNAIKKDINELVNNHQSTINIINNYRYLNSVHMYYLYEQKIYENYDILKFKKNLSILCNNILIEKTEEVKNNKVVNKFSFTLLNNVDNNEIYTNNTDDYNHYLLSHDNCTIVEDSVWYYILEKNKSGVIGKNTNQLFTYVDNTEDIKNVGYIIIPIIKEINDNKLLNNYQLDLDNITFKNRNFEYIINEGFNINNIEIIDNVFYYNTENYQYKMFFEFTPQLKNINTNEYFDYDVLNEDIIKTDYIENIIYAKLDLHYYEVIQYLNVFGYYNSQTCSNFKLNTEDSNLAQCSVKINSKTYNNVILHKSAKYVSYNDIIDNYAITELNPSLYWYSPNDNINMIEDININHYEDNTTSVLNEDPRYINYLCQNLTGTIGTYELALETPNEYAEICVDVTKDNQTITYSSSNNNIFTLNGDETNAVVYFHVNMNSNVTKTTIIPHIYYCTYENTPIKYNKNITQQELVNLYKEFFYKKYSVSLLNNSEQTVLKNIWDSYINITNDEDNIYDTYLMHDNNYWYFMFISKNTCDDPKVYASLKQNKESLEFGKYTLKHISTKQLFLINRMKVNYAKNIYHFNRNDLIVCTLYNNKMLPTNMNITSKWAFTPISVGANTKNIIYANTNTAIISMPNNNLYDRGYYNLQVNYALDNNVVNYQTINKKILIK